MNTRRIILIVLVVLIGAGLANFVWNSVQTRSQLAEVASKDAASQENGVRQLMARGVLFDALQGGAPPETRLNGIAALQRLAAGGKAPEAFKQLLQMLKDPDTEAAEAKKHPVRDAAKDAVAKVGTDYPDLLLDAAKDPDGNIHDQSRAALKAIGAPLEKQMANRLGDAALRAPLGDILSSIGPETIPLIAPYLQPPLLKTDAKPDDLAKAKIELIETLGKFKVPEAAAPLLPFQKDPDPNVRRSVVTSLANIDQPVCAPVLIAALNDPNTDASARAAAAGALGAIATPEANAAMQKALSDYDLSVANAAAAGLKRAGDRAAPAVLQALADPNPDIRARAASATGGMRTTTLAAKALADRDAGVRAVGADAMGEVLFRAETIHKDMQGLASASDDKTQKKAYDIVLKDGALMELLAPGAPAEARSHAIAALNALAAEKKNDKDRKPFLDTIAKLSGGSAASGEVPATPLADVSGGAIAPLVSAVGDADGTVAQNAARALSRLGAVAVAPLIADLSSPNDTVAYYASQALSGIGRPAVDALLPVAQVGKPGARWAAITLGQIGDTRAAAPLQTLSQSPDPDTANAATQALAKVRPS